MHKTLAPLTCAAMVISVAAIAAAGCTTTNTTSQGWGNQPPYSVTPGRTGQVEWIQETVERREGNSGAGAVAGAVIGGIIGHALSGGHGGALFGAAHGALIGASASSTVTTRVVYQVVVRFDDGDARSFFYEGWPPFQIGQPVQEAGQGLIQR